MMSKIKIDIPHVGLSLFVGVRNGRGTSIE